MKRLLYLILALVLIVFGGMSLILRSQAPRGILMPDAVPVTGTPAQFTGQPTGTPPEKPGEGTASGVLGAETARFQTADGTLSFRYPADWKIERTEPGEGSGPYGRILNLLRIAPGGIQGSETTVPYVEMEISEIPDANSVDPLKACGAKVRECGVFKVQNREFTRSISNDPSGMTSAAYETFTDTRFYRIYATIPETADESSYLKTADAIVASIQLR